MSQHDLHNGLGGGSGQAALTGLWIMALLSPQSQYDPHNGRRGLAPPHRQMTARLLESPNAGRREIQVIAVRASCSSEALLSNDARFTQELGDLLHSTGSYLVYLILLVFSEPL